MAGRLAPHLLRLLQTAPPLLARLLQPLLLRWPADEGAHGAAHDTTRSIQQIGGGLGFADAGYFTRFFQRQTGHTPSAWRALAVR